MVVSDDERIVKEKILGVSGKGSGKKIYVSHLTVRQSISILLTKVILVEVIAGAGVIFFHTVIISTRISDLYFDQVKDLNVFNVPIFVLLVFIKLLITVILIFRWLLEYYEIYSGKVKHIRGLFFRKEDEYRLSHIESIKINQTFLGKVFNYGTITLFDWINQEEIKLVLIHNPKKYSDILRELIPLANVEKKVFREQLFYEDRN